MIDNRLTRILLIEDDVVDQMAFKRMVNKQNPDFTHVVAGSVQEARRALTDHEFDVVVSDFLLGDGTLFDILSEVVARGLPVIVTTVIGDESTAIQAIRDGADDYILKDPEHNYLKLLPITIEKAIANKMMVKALRESEEQFRNITSSANDGIILIDKNGAIVFWNPAAERMFGYTTTEVLGRDLHELLALPRDDDHHKGWFATFKGSLPSQITEKPLELTGLCRDGKSIPVEVTVSLFSLQEDNFATVIIRNISERKKVEHALQQAREAAETANRAKSQFLANMSHEIRTPMNGIIGMAELLLETSLDEQQREFACTIMDSSRALLTVINDILDLSRIEAGHMYIENISFELLPLLQSVIRIVSLEAEKKGLSFRCLVDPRLPPVLIGGPSRLRQILLNLLINAVKFTDQGHVTLQVMLESGLKPSLRFEVIDTGIGIHPEYQKHLFKPFTQVDSSTTRTYGGSGLGLVICKRLVEAMGGSIGVKSSPGEGSTFWFVVPLTTPSAEEDSSSEPEGGFIHTASDVESRTESFREHSVAENQGPLILLVEDDPVAQKVARFQLHRLGYSVHIAQNGREAVEAAFKNDYVLILMDCHMPVMDGFDATRAIREVETEQERHVPIIAMTTRAMEGDRELCQAAGMDDYLSKPVELVRLKEMLQGWIPGN